MMARERHNGYFQIQWILPKLVLRLETMYEARGQDNIASASIQTYDHMKLLSWTLWMKNEIQGV